MQRNYNSNKKNFLYTVSLISIVVAVWCCQLGAKPVGGFDFGISNSTQTSLISQKVNAKIKYIKAKDLDSNVLKLALTAYYNAQNEGHNPSDILSVVDYSIASTKPRMWVIDLRTDKVLYHTHVAHGIGSGDNYAYKFSNRHGSKMSSLGLFKTGGLYNGKYGNSLDLHGIDGNFNSNAYARRIVVHPAHYVSDGIIRKIGRLGRSFGCLALNAKVANSIMNTIKGGSLIFCYYPDQNWLKSSPLLRL